MPDDDDWETDPDFENSLTEAERRRAGSAAAVEGLRQERNTAFELSRAFARGAVQTGDASQPKHRAVPAAAAAPHAGARGRRAIGVGERVLALERLAVAGAHGVTARSPRRGGRAAKRLRRARWRARPQNKNERRPPQPAHDLGAEAGGSPGCECTCVALSRA